MLALIFMFDDSNDLLHLLTDTEAEKWNSDMKWNRFCQIYVTHAIETLSNPSPLNDRQ